MLEKLGLAATDTRFVMNEISIDMMQSTASLWRSQGRRGGGSWKRLKKGTQRKKGMTKILYTEGAKDGYTKYGNDTLFRSLTEPGARYQIREISGGAIEFGTDRPWAGVLEFGSEKKGIPPRPFIKFARYDFSRWREMIIDHLMKAAKERNPW